MYILRQFPFQDKPTTVKMNGETILIRPFQIILWVSLGLGKNLVQISRCFPAVLDTGHNHNFSIQERQLAGWTDLRPSNMPRLGLILVNRQEIPLISGELWLQRNRPGTNELLLKPFCLKIPQGIACYPEGTPNAPRLPLLGLRALVQNQLQLTIDGQGKTVTLRAPKSLQLVK